MCKEDDPWIISVMLYSDCILYLSVIKNQMIFAVIGIHFLKPESCLAEQRMKPSENAFNSIVF